MITKPMYFCRCLNFNRIVLVSLGFVFFTSVSLNACNIPVFRYALERWNPDPVQILYFSETAVTTDRLLHSLGRKAEDEAPLNVDVQHVDPKQLGSLAELAADLNLELAPDSPQVVVQTSLNDRKVCSWQGSLKVAGQSLLLDSPKRNDLKKRLTEGDSIVWLLLKSTNEKRNKAVHEMLLAECQALAKQLKLPEGIGQPGSELYSDVPLVLDFSVLEIDPNDSQEGYLVQLLQGFHPEQFAGGEPILAPVFGRGRVLEVLPANAVDKKLIRELTTFLCGACSCKVKGLNPGFDLLMAANWDVDLFGEDGERPSADGPIQDTPLPTLISIPPGRKD